MTNREASADSGTSHSFVSCARTAAIPAEEAKEITTTNTPIGLLRWTCLPYGIKTASAIFQRALENTLEGKNEEIIIYQDDVCIGAKTLSELREKVHYILSTLQQAGMQINERKCVFETNEISFLGFITWDYSR
mgnify:CR=1 FL=1